MSDKLTKKGQYLGQGGKDGDDKSTVTRTSSAGDDRTKAVKPAPEVK